MLFEAIHRSPKSVAVNHAEGARGVCASGSPN